MSWDLRACTWPPAQVTVSGRFEMQGDEVSVLPCAGKMSFSLLQPTSGLPNVGGTWCGRRIRPVGVGDGFSVVVFGEECGLV